jgi:hypothetical protein
MIENEPELMPWAATLETERVFEALAKNRMSYGE